MAVAKWAAFQTESANLAGTALDNRANSNLPAFVVDIDNTGDRDLYASFWIEFGTIGPTAPGFVTLSLRRKRGSVYAENPCEQVISAVTGTGARVFALEFLMRLPGPGVYGLYFTNNLGISTAASGNALYRSDFNEDVT
ncbi:MAG: hypothetical protein INF93_18870 [Rhodobacter sp.]|jgi:hypothetical protein|nr:hypothetical protein [Rhodobacter sp.]